MAQGDAPLRWDDKTNVRWKTEISGRGHSTPVIAGDKLFLTTAVPTGKQTADAGRGADAGLEHRFDVLAVDRASGRVAWRRTATVATPHEGYHHLYGSFASNSPVTDGQRVFAFFGSRGLYAYDAQRRAALEQRLRREDADGRRVGRGHAADAARQPSAAALRSPRSRFPRDARPCDGKGNLARQTNAKATTGRRRSSPCTKAGVRS